MENDYLVVPNFLAPAAFGELAQACRKWHFKQFIASNDLTLQLAIVPNEFSKLVDEAAMQATGLKLEALNTFARLNSSKYDTEFRVHSDGYDMGVYPDIAMVLYVDTTPGYGTALFRHPEHGDRAPYHVVFSEDDGKWERYKFYEAVANSAFFYNASLFHCRYPYVAYGKTQKDGRIVIVKFFKELK